MNLEARMTTSDYALIVSIVSILIAIGALAWNVWQKFIFVKPSLQVSFGVWKILKPSVDGIAYPTGKQLLNLTVTNMGPGPVTLSACIARSRYRGKNKSRMGMLNPIHGDLTSDEPTSLGPFSAGLPMKIDAGDTKSFYFPYELDSFLAEGILRVGINDTYQRNTWCRRSDMRKVNAQYSKDFPAKNND
jgi:hypothetical protein